MSRQHLGKKIITNYWVLQLAEPWVLIIMLLSFVTLCWKKTKRFWAETNFNENPHWTLREKNPYSKFFWCECGKIRTKKTPNMDTFDAVEYSNIIIILTSLHCLRLQWYSASRAKKSERISGKRQFLILNNSVAKACIFQSCIGNKPSLVSNSS